MRNLKRALSLALAAVMVLGLMIVGAGAADVYEDFTDKDEIQNQEAVATMVTLGVIEGKEDGSYFDPTGTVTRAEMAKIVAVCLSGGVDPVTGSDSNTVRFSDVPTTHWAYKYISFCVQQNIIAGRGDGTFGPEDPVTGSAAAKMFLCALGYSASLHGLTGVDWELNTNVLANQNAGLYEGLSGINASAGLSRDNTAQMAYNAVQADEVNYTDGTAIDGVPPIESNGTMLANRFEVVKFTGILEANDKLSVANGAANHHGTNAVARENESLVYVTAIGDDRFNRTQYGNLYDAQTFKVDTPDELVGQEIVLYVKLNNWLSPNAASSTVLGSAIATDSNTVVETSSRLKNTDAVRSTLRAGGLTSVGTPTAFLYNENGRSAGTASGVTDTIIAGTHAGFGTRSAGVLQRFIDNDADGQVEYLVQILPALTSVSVVNTSSEKYTFAAASIGSQSFADVVSDEELAKDDVVLITRYSDDKYYVTAPETVEGTVTAFDTGSNTVTIDSTAYGNGAGATLTTLNNIAWELNAQMVGNTYRLYLDAAGNVLGYEIIDEAIGHYAIVLGYTVSGSTSMGYTARVKLLDETGAEATYDLNVEETAVKVGEANADDTSKEKNDALFVDDVTNWFDPDYTSGNAQKVLNKLFSYSIGDDNSVTLSYAEEVNSYYDSQNTTIADDTDMSKNVSNYGGAVADENTVFFFENDTAGSWSVVTGLSKLPSLPVTTDGVGEVITYQGPNSNTKAAKAIHVKLTSDFVASMDYAYISGDPSITQASNGATLYTYPVVLGDGTVTTLTSKTNNAAKEQVWEYSTDGDYVKFSAPTDEVHSARVDYLGNGAVGLVDADTDASIGSYVLTSDTIVLDVQDTENVQNTTLSLNNKVAIILDASDKTIEAVFVYDNMLGDLAANVTVNGISNSSNQLTYTAGANQTVTISVNGTQVWSQAEGDTAQARTVNLTTALATGDEVTVEIAQANKDTRTMTYTV